jgi:hypothetical protein
VPLTARRSTSTRDGKMGAATTLNKRGDLCNFNFNATNANGDLLLVPSASLGR